MAMTLELAKKIINTAITKAKKMEKACSVAVVDENGWLVALHRMDSAPIPTVDIARDKAWTAATFRLPSSEVSRFGDPRASGFGLNAQNWNDRLTTIPGGLPIHDGDRVIGAVGVCGGTPQEDLAICQATIKALNEM